ncbi:MAG: Glutamate synthase [NADPH] large chain (EC [uncultured Sulfurovum sp.]|uniref:Glutamate synthase [NADPH] large chain (EC) n=1 Tax=uncultured Sulfurovum sp. TaxID=269237 RepID=A0A6S6TPB5_9BACT|nr:MAG: Glutamate synthase [NADPH] large chain (EC [uncultured Sulfurovum sp.]
MKHSPVTLNGTSVEMKREEIRKYFLESYNLYEKVFELLKDDAVFYKQSEPSRQPMIFYFGHTATFYINKLILAGVITKRINPEFESMFAIGVDEMTWDDMNQEHYKWAKVSEVRAYRQTVKELVLHLIETLPMSLPITQDSAWWIILMGIEHEHIHIETSSVLHRQMPLEFIKPVEAFQPCTNFPDAPQNELLQMQGETVVLGKDKNHHLYGWDNEYGTKNKKVEAFKVSKYLVSNAEYLPFVMADGYKKEEYWDEEGQAFLKNKNAKHPPFWVLQEDKSFKLRLLDKEIDLPLSWAVEVNALEAMAFCRWKSEKEETKYGLPSETQWHYLYNSANIQDFPNFDVQKANVNFAHYASPCPVNEFSFGELYDVMGNVWQWTNTPIDGFKGFEVHPMYDDFSTPTFDGKHNLMKGGSFASTGNELMQHSRYAFRRHFYQHAGFRYIKTDEENTMETNTTMKTDKTDKTEKIEIKENENIYEHDELVNQYSDFQYGETYFGVENFAAKTAQLAIEYSKDTPQNRALDIGCATGRCSFELANVFEEVTGIDFSARFIQVAVNLQEQKVVKFKQKVEGDIYNSLSKNIDEFSFAEVKDRVEFWQGDACNLKAHFTGYDLILGTNLIDRLYEPKLFLENIHERLNKNGVLILTSPYTWQEESTNKEFWLGGFKNEKGEEQYTLEGLKEILEKNFELVETQDVPFVIRETARKFQHTLSQMSVWKKI